MKDQLQPDNESRFNGRIDFLDTLMRVAKKAVPYVLLGGIAAFGLLNGSFQGLSMNCWPEGAKCFCNGHPITPADLSCIMTGSADVLQQLQM